MSEKKLFSLPTISLIHQCTASPHPPNTHTLQHKSVPAIAFGDEPSDEEGTTGDFPEEDREDDENLYSFVARSVNPTNKRSASTDALAAMMTVYEERDLKRTKLVLDALQAFSHALHSHVTSNSRGSVTAVRRMFAEQFCEDDTTFVLGGSARPGLLFER